MIIIPLFDHLKRYVEWNYKLVNGNNKIYHLKLSQMGA